MATKYYPFVFEPLLKEKIWGGHKLNAHFNKGENATAKVGESWEIADLPEGQSIVAQGALAGQSLKQLISRDADALLGKEVHKRFGEQFPLLIKFIDAKTDLSIQVHPEDHNSPTGVGKTEMWYIMQADPGAKLVVGFEPGMDRDAFKRHIDDNTVEEAMNTHIVQPGDAFFINAGRIHAIGGGVVLAEIQQTSDVTYRVYDYNRKDDNGQLRDLHVEESLNVLDYADTEDFKLKYPKKTNEVQELKHHTYFKTDWLHLVNGIHKVDRRSSFTILIVVDGSLTYTFEHDAQHLVSGQSVLIPASCGEVVVEADDCKVLEVSL